MRIITKRLKVIQMTNEEIRSFHDLMEQAQQGQEVHYAEQQLSDGSFLGVSVVSDEIANPRFAKSPKAYSE